MTKHRRYSRGPALDDLPLTKHALKGKVTKKKQPKISEKVVGFIARPGLTSATVIRNMAFDKMWSRFAAQILKNVRIGKLPRKGTAEVEGGRMEWEVVRGQLKRIGITTTK